MATEAVQTIYLWQGLDKTGSKTKGEIPGASQALVKAQLRKQGINPTKVRRKPKNLFGPKKQKIKPNDILFFIFIPHTLLHNEFQRLGSRLLN